VRTKLEKEAAEAEEAAKELKAGGGGGAAAGGGEGESLHTALTRAGQKRQEQLLASLEAKYAGAGGKSKRGKVSGGGECRVMVGRQEKNQY
jgi:hypothetical protein